MQRPVRLTRGVPTISALSATPIIGLNQHYGVATLVGEAGGESKSAKWCRVVPRVVQYMYSCTHSTVVSVGHVALQHSAGPLCWALGALAALD